MEYQHLWVQVRPGSHASSWLRFCWRTWGQGGCFSEILEGETCRVTVEKKKTSWCQIHSDTLRLPPLQMILWIWHHSACQLKLIKEFCTDLDFLGVNSYGEDGICKHIVFTSNLLVWKHPNQPAKIIYTSLLFKSSVFSSKMMQHG